MATIADTHAYAAPGRAGSPVELKDRYDNFIGGEWVPPTTGEYRANVSPGTGKPFCEIASSAPRGHRTGAGCRPQGCAFVGQDLRHRARGHPEQDCRPH